jgi:two-component system cell cycle response regulator
MDTPKPTPIVLVVDDSPVARKLVEHALPKEEYTLLFASTGREALDLFVTNRPALVITDWLMPDLSGVELCERIRADAAARHTHIVLLTGVSEKTKVVKGLQAGADDYLTKPFHPDELLARVRVGRRLVEQSLEIEAKNRQLQQLALADELTGLPNRRAIEIWASRQLSAATRYEFTLWVILADLDHLKAINDNYGNEAGDTVLKKFAEILDSTTRHSDMSARIGGEKFMLVITHADLAGAQLVSERLRERIEREKFSFGGKEVTVTTSFGIAANQLGKARDFGLLVQQAEAALASAKRLGRNRVETDAIEVR